MLAGIACIFVNGLAEMHPVVEDTVDVDLTLGWRWAAFAPLGNGNGQACGAFSEP